MCKIQTDYSLLSLNTLGFDQRAEYFVSVNTEDEICSALEFARQRNLPVSVIGSGSNIVLTRDVSGLVLHCGMQHIHYHDEQADGSVLVTAGAGVNWHHLVIETLSKDLAGLENLSLIPGLVGAAPVQNIGAYGVELKDRMSSLRALHIPSGEWQKFTVADCAFAYRDSLFKQHKGEYLITQVTFRLGSLNAPETSYASLADWLEKHHLEQPGAAQISDAVIAIRQSRLPDPQQVGNAGSFFHNPVVARSQATELKRQYEQLVTYEVSDSQTKLSAAWMIDQLGFRGVRRGSVGVYEKQALVLINHLKGTQNGPALLALAAEIQTAVASRFGVQLEIEPLVI